MLFLFVPAFVQLVVVKHDLLVFIVQIFDQLEHRTHKLFLRQRVVLFVEFGDDRLDDAVYLFVDVFDGFQYGNGRDQPVFVRVQIVEQFDEALRVDIRYYPFRRRVRVQVVEVVRRVRVVLFVQRLLLLVVLVQVALVVC